MIRIAFLLFFSVTALHSQSLKVLPGKIPTEYSEGYLVRAQTLQQILLQTQAFFEKRYPQYAFSVKLKVADSVAWTQLGYRMPYGMPHYDGKAHIVLPADKKAMFPDTSDDAQISPYDAISIHELGHYFMTALVKTDIYPNWANEFIAAYFQVIFAKENGVSIQVPANNTPKHRSLEDFEKGFQVVADDYGWYQAQFTRLAERLYAVHGTKVLDAFIANYQPGGKNADALDVLRAIDNKIVNDWFTEMK